MAFMIAKLFMNDAAANSLFLELECRINKSTQSYIQVSYSGGPLLISRNVLYFYLVVESE